MTGHELERVDRSRPTFRSPDAVIRYRPGAEGRGTDHTPPRQLREYLAVLAKHRQLALACFAGTLALTLAVTLLTPRRYTASTRLQVARQSPVHVRLTEERPLDTTDAVTSATFVATQVAALTSRDLAARVLERPELADARAFLAGTADGVLTARAIAVPEALRPRGWLPEGDRKPAASSAAVPVDPRLVDRYTRYLSVSEVGGTDLIEVSFTTPAPELSAFLAAAHTQAYMAANEDARRATDSVTTRFLDQQVEESREEIRVAEDKIAAFATEHPNVAINEDQKVVAGRIAELASFLTKAEAARATIESRFEFLRDPSSDRLAYFLNEPGVEKLRLSLLDVRAQEAALRPRLGPNHPQMLELAELEAAIAEQLNGEVEQGVQSVKQHYAAAQSRENRLREKLERQQELGIGLRGLGAQYDLLRKDVDTARTLHTALLRQRNETRVNAALVPNVRIVERPEVPHKPSRPKVPLNLVLGLFGGTVIAVGAAFVREYLDASVKSSDDVEDLLQLPTLAAIPNFAVARRIGGFYGNGNGNGNGHRNGDVVPHAGDDLLVVHEPWSRVAEDFRSLRTLLFSTGEAPPKVILLTSARPGEGKTVASLNLASTLAELGGRTLLVDADLRHPRCHTVLGVPHDTGLTSCLTGEADSTSVIRTLDVPNLFFLPAGPAPKNPAELVAAPRMRALLAALREQFDYVVIDTPPVLPVTDAAILAREVDGVVLVVKGHETPGEAVRRARDRLGLAGARFLGVLVNNVGVGWGDAYVPDTYYGYGGPRRA